jgi:DNA-binding winged helix-turn-helix (wHTH) protein
MPPTRYAPAHHGDQPTLNQSPAPAEPEIEFGRFRVLPRQRELLADGAPVELGARAFDILLALIEANGSLVTKEELLNRVWPNRIVEENNLTVQILALRKALGDDRGVIRTEYGRGYRLLTARAQPPLQAPTPRTTTESRRRDRRTAHDRSTQCVLSGASGGTVPASSPRSSENGVSDGFGPKSRWQMRRPRATDRYSRAFLVRAGRAVA